MIPQAQIPKQAAPAWQHELRHAFSSPLELLRYLELDPAHPALEAGQLRDFPLRVPRGFAARMRKGDPQDPLFLQIWPQVRESETAEAYKIDAVGDLKTTRPGGILHKYQNRVLVMTTGACAVHCRYCFRRHFPYSEQLAARDQWREALNTIDGDSSIEEVILSGGDPLSLTDEKLAYFADAVAAIPHVQRLRLHTRQPIVLPERVDHRLLEWLGRGRLEKIVVLHANHPAELDASVASALRKLRSLPITLLNQSVLLRGINDRPDVLVQLSKRLFNSGVLPYYLHLLDHVQGAAHFEVPEHEARILMNRLSSHLPGYLVPRLVREIAGEPSKTWIAW